MTVKYVSSSASGADDGTSPTHTSGTTGPWTFAQMLAATFADGDEVRIMADGTYTRVATGTVSWNNNITVTGANSSGTVDGTRPTVTSATNSVVLFQMATASAGFRFHFKHLKLTHTAATRGICVSCSGITGSVSRITLSDCWIDGCSKGFESGNRCGELVLARTSVLNSTSVGIDGPATMTLDGSMIFNSGGVGLTHNAGDPTFFYLTNSVISKNAGDGVSAGGGATRTSRLHVRCCTIVDNTGDGIESVVTTGTLDLVSENNVFANNGGYDVNMGTSTSVSDANCRANYFNFYGSGSQVSTSGSLRNLSAGDNDGTFTADPFTNRSAGDFSLNNTAGGGAALRAAGFPGAFPGGTTGYLDIGAAQHQDAGGGAPSPTLGAYVETSSVRWF